MNNVVAGGDIDVVSGDNVVVSKSNMVNLSGKRLLAGDIFEFIFRLLLSGQAPGFGKTGVIPANIFNVSAGISNNRIFKFKQSH